MRLNFRTFRRFGSLWLAAAGVPVLAYGAAALVNGEPGSWPTLAVMRASIPDALLYAAASLLIAAPLCGVAVASGSEVRQAEGGMATALEIAWPLVIAAVLLSVVSAVLTIVAIGSLEAAGGFVVRSHLTIAAVALALAMLGGVCGALLGDPLDAAAASLCLVMLAACGVLVSGTLVADAPRALLDVALTASPLVAISAAANIDIVRMDPLYSISPLAGLRIDYPTWYAACGWYTLVTAGGFVGLTIKGGAPEGDRVLKGLS